MRRASMSAAIVALAALGVGATEASAVGAQASAAKVKVTLVEFKLTLSTKHVPAGKVTFIVHDAGKIPHMFVVLRTKTPAAKLPTNGAVAVETGKVGKIGPLAPGATKNLTLTLKRGHYALICNMPGHYKAGQFADFSVG